MNSSAHNDIELTERERDMLEFERTWWRQQGSKEDAIRRQFTDLTATRYFQQLIALLARPEVLLYDPVLVKRLRRVYLRRHVA
jgi:hypothetical protein